MEKFHTHENSAFGYASDKVIKMNKIKIFSLIYIMLNLTACSLPNNDKQDSLHNPESIDRLSYSSPSTKQATISLPTKKLLSTYTSPILTTDKNRYHNITLVRDRLNGYILENNATFSYNQVCGPYGKKDGFKKAMIQIGKGKQKKDYGGGVCQLSSTLYNAVKDLSIDITERHHHSTPVNYVPKNDDATVSLKTGLDFQFINRTGYPIEFSVSSTEKELTVSVYQITS